MNTTIKVSLPENLVAQANSLVQEGWEKDFDDLLAVALRRYLDFHSSDLSERFILEDVAWGLDGTN